VSIDCGLDASSGSYTDTQTGIEYEPDGPYVDAGAGENRMVGPDLESLFDRGDQTLRSFPSGLRNCYALPTVSGTKYLVRGTFAYGNYDGRNSSSLEFDLHLGPNYWRTVRPDAKTSYAHEAIFVAWAGWAPICLVNTGRGTPFVSVLELRPLEASLYPQVTPGLILSLYKRRNMGATISTIRYVLHLLRS
jgi:hypothetical protein